jgi:sulfite reductase (ferredoxin)
MSTETRIDPSPPAAAPPKRSAVEAVKESSRQLRGSIAEELPQETDHFNEQNKQLLKFHGTYQQEDRDARKNRSKAGAGKHHMFMVRCKISGGRLTAAQYLAVDALAGAHANGTLRFTTRQGIQLHGVLKSHLKETIAGINECLLSTLGACGDVERNVMACPAPHYHQGIHAQLQETAAILAAHLAPRTRAYHEIWLNGKPVGRSQESGVRSQESGVRSQESEVRSQESGVRSQESEVRDGQGASLTPDSCPLTPDLEPLYGKVYLPRKFKTGLALPEDNCIDVHAQDLGLLAIVENGTIIGYNVLVGGGMGMTHGNANTFPHLARPICYVPASAVVTAAEAVVRLFRDHGNRADRKRARIKYLVHDWGVEKFREVLSGYIGGALQEPRPIQVSGYDPHLGWHSQGNGKWYYGLSVENGRVKDEGTMRLRSGLRALVERFQPSIRLTPLQDILLCDLEASARPEIEHILAEFGIARPEQVSAVQRYSMACPAIPTCGLAITESERTLPAIIDQLEAELKRLGLENEKLSVRMTGCPNGCARPYQSDIGLVGRSGDKYTLFVGGRILGDRLNFALRDLVPLVAIVPTLVPLLEHFAKERRTEETFGDYCHRLGVEKLQMLLPPVPAKETRAGHDAPAAAPRQTSNGNGHPHGTTLETNGAGAALAPAETKLIALGLPESGATAEPIAAEAARQSETFFAGPAGEELRDYTLRFHSDGSVRETAIYFYGEDLRAAAAHAGDPLRREAVYAGRVDPFRLHATRKLSDTHYVGSVRHERADRRIDYHADGGVAQTVLFYYEGDVRAGAAPSGAALRREVVVTGAHS